MAKRSARTARTAGKIVKNVSLGKEIFSHPWALLGVVCYVVGLLILMVKATDWWSLVFVVLGALLMWWAGYTVALVRYR